MLNTLSNLSTTEKIMLVESLRDSIAVDQSTLLLTSEQKAELDRRLDAYEFDGIKGRIAVSSLNFMVTKKLNFWKKNSCIIQFILYKLFVLWIQEKFLIDYKTFITWWRV